MERRRFLGMLGLGAVAAWLPLPVKPELQEWVTIGDTVYRVGTDGTLTARARWYAERQYQREWARWKASRDALLRHYGVK